MPRVAFLFPGQGAQAVGMGRVLCDALPTARALFDDAAGILGLDRPQVEAICATASSAGLVKVANLLCPGNIAVSGARPVLVEVERLATEQGARTVRLAVAGAFHTDLMKPADEQLAEALGT